MTNQFEPPSSSSSLRSRRRRVGWTIRITPAGVLILVLINLLILGGWAYGIGQVMTRPDFLGGLFPNLRSYTPTEAIATSIPATLTPTSQPTASSTVQPTDSPTPNPVTPSPQPIGTLTLNQGLIILALDEGGNTHLFVYQPAELGAGLPLPLTRLSYGPWDDINPAISPDGKTIAFASNRSGYWDIYLMDLDSAGITRLTDTLEYDGAPAWSPDNKWLVYETYVNDNLELKIQSVITPSDTIMLTDNPAADFSPAWSPQGRGIAFVSNRSGEDEIWLANLDNSDEERFQDISQNPNSQDTHPVWSPDGTAIVWASEQDGMRNLFLNELQPAEDVNATPPALNQRNLGSGDWPIWSADGENILTILQSPNRVYLTAYRANYPGLVLPALELPGAVSGLSWGNVSLSSPVQVIYQQAIQLTPTPLYLSVVASPPENNGGRYQLSELAGVEAPNPYLHDLTDESYQSLRARIATEVGWDFLATLENAYIPLTSPLEPGMGNDWLYTGRAIALDILPMDAGWLAVVREDFGSETYWRVYIQSFYQDGSAGIPMHDQPWDFDSRYSGDTTEYEQGGAMQTTVPTGYWIDFTVRAHSYGWERLPALSTWRASYPAARFNEFASTGKLDWETAMLELYPPETMITPSPVVPPTRTPTATPRWYVSPTPSPTSTPRPTYTPEQMMPTYTPAVPGG
jgi:TolB protein